MDQKGQYLSLEQMILFTVSVIVMVLIYYSFSTLRQKAGESIIEDQLREVSEIALGGIYRVENQHTDDGKTYKRIEYDIPKEISGQMYKIDIRGGEEVHIQSEGGEEVVKPIGKPSENLDIVKQDAFMDGVSSRKGKLEIVLDDNEIKIGR
ncbi:MAG: hypothetical protein ACLFQ8_03190 [Candidatus Aenigmatarchaeota archaeon]